MATRTPMRPGARGGTGRRFHTPRTRKRRIRPPVRRRPLDAALAGRLIDQAIACLAITVENQGRHPVIGYGVLIVLAVRVLIEAVGVTDRVTTVGCDRASEETPVHRDLCEEGHHRVAVPPE